jgi:DNA-binding CsgD family transcriptional regulator
MGRLKTFQLERNRTRGYSIHPKEFVFVDKRTGMRRFEVKADKDGHMPVEQAVSLLAIYCVARQQLPRDFGVMVAASRDLYDGIAERATKLIQLCSGAKMPGFPLSRRQREVLANVTQNMTNKEIAAKLNVSVRTIKFHVSTLLEKFDVQGRVDLMLESAAFLPVQSVRKRATDPETMALGHVRTIPSLAIPAKLCLTVPVERTSSRPTGVGKRERGCTNEPSSSITSPQANRY